LPKRRGNRKGGGTLHYGTVLYGSITDYTAKVFS
jgi:hypothetical protein